AVNQTDQPVLPRNRSRLSQIDDAQGGIRRRFEVKKFRIGAYRSLVLIVIGRLYKCGLDSPFRQVGGKELRNSAVNITLCNDMIPACDQAEDAGSDCVHAGGK